jgi:hypothetical protein
MMVAPEYSHVGNKNIISPALGYRYITWIFYNLYDRINSHAKYFLEHNHVYIINNREKIHFDYPNFDYYDLSFLLTRRQKVGLLQVYRKNSISGIIGLLMVWYVYVVLDVQPRKYRLSIDLDDESCSKITFNNRQIYCIVDNS